MLTTTLHFCRRLWRARSRGLNDRVPKHNIVGTKRCACRARCHFLASRCIAAMETICMAARLMTIHQHKQAARIAPRGSCDPEIFPRAGEIHGELCGKLVGVRLLIGASGVMLCCVTMLFASIQARLPRR